MPEPGVHEFRLFDGACIVDALVEAPPQQVAAAFGEAVQLAGEGALIEGASFDGIVLHAAGWPGIGWSVIEAATAPEAADDDYIITMLKQAGAALEGQVLELPRAYENGLGLAREAAIALGTRAATLWGSDEWCALGGGAELDSSGEIVRACNIAGPDEIARALADRESMDDEAEEDDDEPENDHERLYVFAPGSGLTSIEADAIEYLDAWFKELGAVQPEMPPTLLQFAAAEFGEIWGARA